MDDKLKDGFGWEMQAVLFLSKEFPLDSVFWIYKSFKNNYRKVSQILDTFY